MLINQISEKLNTNTRFLFKCDECGIDFERVNKAIKRMSKNKYFNPETHLCQWCWRGMLSRTSESRKNKSVALKKLYKTKRGKEILKKMSKKLKGINSGDKSPMRRPEVVEKNKASRRKYLENPDNIKKISERNKKAWRDGKFSSIHGGGKCKWFKYTHSNGNVYNVQGTWELEFIKWLDEKNMIFTCHKGRIPYILNEGHHTYHPDFWVEKWDSYIDVKCKFYYNEEKFNAIRLSNPEMNLKILYKKDLQELGVKIK